MHNSLKYDGHRSFVFQIKVLTHPVPRMDPKEFITFLYNYFHSLNGCRMQSESRVV